MSVTPERVAEALSKLDRIERGYREPTRSDYLVLAAALREAQAENEELRRSVLLEMENGRLAQAAETWQAANALAEQITRAREVYDDCCNPSLSAEDRDRAFRQLGDALAVSPPADEAKP